MPTTNPVQWTADQVLAQLASAKTRFQTEWDALGQNNLDLNALQAQTNTIADAGDRAAAQQGLVVWANRQVQLQNNFIAAYGRYQAAYNQVAAFLRAVGLSAPPDTGLHGMGIAPALVIVPAVVVAVVVTAIAYAAWMHDQNVTQRQGLTLQSAALDDLVAGRISSADYLAATGAAAATAKPPKPPGDDWTKIVLPALGLVALIVMGPQIMRMIPSRAKAAA